MGKQDTHSSTFTLLLSIRGQPAATHCHSHHATPALKTSPTSHWLLKFASYFSEEDAILG